MGKRKNKGDITLLFISKILFWVTCAYKIIVLSCLKIWRKKDCLLVVSFLPFIYFMIKIWDDSDSDPLLLSNYLVGLVFSIVFFICILIYLNTKN
ncbi:hypothetical protein CWE29_06220 [Enterococcus faecium]|nr:hypothetical protein CWE29_06220 [Enterococcus faecium]